MKNVIVSLLLAVNALISYDIIEYRNNRQSAIVAIHAGNEPTIFYLLNKDNNYGIILGTIINSVYIKLNKATSYEEGSQIFTIKQAVFDSI